ESRSSPGSYPKTPQPRLRGFSLRGTLQDRERCAKARAGAGAVQEARTRAVTTGGRFAQCVVVSARRQRAGVSAPASGHGHQGSGTKAGAPRHGPSAHCPSAHGRRRAGGSASLSAHAHQRTAIGASLPAQRRQRTTGGVPPTITTSAGRRANRPTLTTPGIWFSACSSATGSVIESPCTSITQLPLSVTVPWRQTGCPPVVATISLPTRLRAMVLTSMGSGSLPETRARRDEAPA